MNTDKENDTKFNKPDSAAGSLNYEFEVMRDNDCLDVWWWKRGEGIQEDDNSGWHQMCPSMPPSQMTDNPGDYCPEEIQQLAWDECDRQWEQWKKENERSSPPQNPRSEA